MFIFQYMKTLPLHGLRVWSFFIGIAHIIAVIAIPPRSRRKRKTSTEKNRSKPSNAAFVPFELQWIILKDRKWGED